MANVRFTWNEDPNTPVPVAKIDIERSTDGGVTWVSQIGGLLAAGPLLSAGVYTHTINNIANGVADFRVVPYDSSDQPGTPVTLIGFDAFDMIPNFEAGSLSAENV